MMSHYQKFHRPQLRPDSPPKPPELEVYMPATPPLAFMAAIEFWVRIFRRRHHFRRLFLPLLKEDDEILADIGFERSLCSSGRAAIALAFPQPRISQRHFL